MEQVSLAGINQRYWNNGLKYFKDGDDAPTAIQNLYSDWNPPFDLNGLATIVGALYADHYWAATQNEGQKMSVVTLANDLRAAIGVNPSDATRAAQAAFSRWYGMFVRANSGSTARAGNAVSASGAFHRALPPDNAPPEASVA